MLAYILSSFITFLHPFFVSVIDIKHNVKDKTIEISTKIFVDDLEKIINKNYHTKIDLSATIHNPENQAAIAKYMQSKLQIFNDNKLLPIKYIGYEVQKESVWIYAEIDGVTTIKKLTINCNLLYDYQEKQTNIFNIKANGSEKNYKLDYPKSSVDFIW